MQETTSGLLQSDEHLLLRQAVSDVVGDFGHAYFAERAVRAGKSTSSGQALADHGFLGVHLPESLRRGRRGHR